MLIPLSSLTFGGTPEQTVVYEHCMRFEEVAEEERGLLSQLLDGWYLTPVVPCG